MQSSTLFFSTLIHAYVTLQNTSIWNYSVSSVVSPTSSVLKLVLLCVRLQMICLAETCYEPSKNFLTTLFGVFSCLTIKVLLDLILTVLSANRLTALNVLVRLLSNTQDDSFFKCNYFLPFCNVCTACHFDCETIKLKRIETKRFVVKACEMHWNLLLMINW